MQWGCCGLGNSATWTERQIQLQIHNAKMRACHMPLAHLHEGGARANIGRAWSREETADLPCQYVRPISILLSSNQVI